MTDTKTRGLIVHPDKRIERTMFDGLASMQAGVCGYIEPIDLRDGTTMYVNEEYAYMGGEVNYLAGDICGVGGRPEYLFRPLLGTVILVGFDPQSGDTVDLPDAGIAMVERVAAEAGATWSGLVNW